MKDRGWIMKCAQKCFWNLQLIIQSMMSCIHYRYWLIFTNSSARHFLTWADTPITYFFNQILTVNLRHLNRTSSIHLLIHFLLIFRHSKHFFQFLFKYFWECYTVYQYDQMCLPTDNYYIIISNIWIYNLNHVHCL